MHLYQKGNDIKRKGMSGVLLLVFVFSITASLAQEWSLASPNGRITIYISNGRGLTYRVDYDDRTVVNPSPLGIVLDDRQFAGELKFVGEHEKQIREAYKLLMGKRKEANNPGNELVLKFENNSKDELHIIFRAYDDGIAFRYYFPQPDDEMHKVLAELSGFAIPKEAKAWIQPYDLNVRMKPCYETYYENGITPGTVSPNRAGWAFPALFAVDNVWMLITEAGLDETYCATHLEDKRNEGVYTIRFPEAEEVTSDAAPEPVSRFPWFTPWRLIMIGPSLNTLQQTMLVTDVCPPSEIKETSWIKPGRASWSWWSQGNTTRSYDIQKKYIDFNASMGWEYVLIDAGWPQMQGGTMEDLVAYAKAKGVGIFLWYHSGMGRESDTVSMSNLMAFPEARRKEMGRIQKLGVKGIKVDFFDSDKQPVIKRYYDIMKDAADYRLMVNFHGSTLPRGWERTYPHLVSMESVKGAEGYGRQQFCDRAPSHNTILPFTRNVVGSMDYTPVTFTNKREAIRRTTYGHELALSIVFESGVFHFADRMESYKALPDEPKTFLMNVPVAWDETRFIAGVPGDFVVLARRKGTRWYIGGINGMNVEHEVILDLPFNKKDAQLRVITDGAQPETFDTRTLTMKDGHVKVKMLPNGGFVATAK